MEPEYRYFKCSLNVEPIKSLENQWRSEREKRNQALNPILDSIPFYEGWRGNEEWCSGIVCHKNNPEFLKIQSEKYYKISPFKEEFVVITGHKRYKKGKELDEKIKQIHEILNQYPSFNTFMLKALKLNCWVSTMNTLYKAGCGVENEHFIVQIPVNKPPFSGDKFPDIPDCLTEIKQSEFLALQGK